MSKKPNLSIREDGLIVFIGPEGDLFSQLDVVPRIMSGTYYKNIII